jgi:hypothetical protein
MKTYSCIFLILNILLFTFSCSEDEDSNPLLGTWTQTSVLASGCTDPSDNGSSSSVCSSTECFKIIFKSNGQGSTEDIVNGIAYKESFTYSVSGNTLTIATAPDVKSYEINGSILTIFQEETVTGCSVSFFHTKN